MAAREAAIAGIGRTAFSKRSGRTPLAMAAEAALVAIGQRVRADLTQFPGAAERAITFRRVDLPATDSPAVRR